MNPLARKLSQGGALDAEDQRRVARVLEAAAFSAPARQVLLAENDVTDHAVVVLEGVACRYKDLRDGTRQIVSLLAPGDFCDVDSHITRAADHGVATLGPCRLAHVPRAELGRWRAESSGLRHGLEWATVVDVAIMREWLVNLGARPAVARAAHLFCEMWDRLATVTPGRRRYDFPLTQVDLSNALGVSAVHVSRIIHSLRGKGLLELRRRELALPDPAALAAFADFSPAYLHPRILPPAADAPDPTRFPAPGRHASPPPAQGL